MPDIPTIGQVDTMLQNTSAVFRTIYNNANANSPNYRDKEDILFQSIEGEFGGSIYNPARNAGIDLGNAIGRAGTSVLALARAYAQVLRFPGTSLDELWPQIFRYFVEQSFSVNSSEFTYGTITAVGSPVGDGAIYRLTKDRWGFDIEATSAETKTFEITRDAGSGARAGEEDITVRGEPAENFNTLQDGSGIIGQLKAISALSTRQFLNNPSFDSDAVSAAPSVVSGWTPTNAIGNYEIVGGTGNYFRIMSGLTAAQSKGLKQTAADVMTQLMLRGLDPATPYMASVRVKPNAADGNAILRVGSNSKSVALTGDPNTWQTIVLDQDTNLWYDNFKQGNLSVSLEWTGTTGDVIWDDFNFAPMQLIDGVWSYPLGGATDWSRNDLYNVTDSQAVATAIIWWFLRQAGVYLPANKAGAETIADPVL